MENDKLDKLSDEQKAMLDEAFVTVTKKEVEFDSSGRAVIKSHKANKFIKKTLKEAEAIAIASPESMKERLNSGCSIIVNVSC